MDQLGQLVRVEMTGFLACPASTGLTELMQHPESPARVEFPAYLACLEHQERQERQGDHLLRLLEEAAAVAAAVVVLLFTTRPLHINKIDFWKSTSFQPGLLLITSADLIHFYKKKKIEFFSSAINLYIFWVFFFFF